MTDIVWISTAMGHASNQRPMMHNLGLPEKLPFPSETLLASVTRKQNDEGTPVNAEEFPTEVFGTPDASERDYNLPDLFAAYGFGWCLLKQQ